MQSSDADAITDWAAAALFSPSKARAQQAQARDWAAVDAWLARKYSPQRIPTFERNEETLSALLTLASVNDSADEQRAQVERVERSALQALAPRRQQTTTTATTTSRDGELLQSLLATLPPPEDTRLENLAELALAADSASPDTTTIARDMIRLTTTHFELAAQATRAETQLRAVHAAQARLNATIAELRSDALQQPDGVDLSATGEWTKTIKHLRAKIGEYQERLGQAAAGGRGATATATAHHTRGFEALRTRVEEVERWKGVLAEHEAELRAYQDLPPDAGLAQAKLREARERLREVTARRERVFEGLVDSG